MRIPPEVCAAADRISPLAFGIIAKSLHGGEPRAIGSGVFIAPYLGLTARHVVEGAWNEFEPEWRRNEWPKHEEVTTHSLLLTQKLHFGRPDEATWVVNEIMRVSWTDLTLLKISPQNDLARAYGWGNGFLDLQLLPPPIGARVWIFGYPECRAENDAERLNVISGDFQIEIHSATVTHVEDARRDALKDFPGFEFAPGLRAGGSGGPVVCGGRLCGIGVVGWHGDAVQPGYAAALWPLIFAKVNLRVGAAPTFLDLMKEGTLVRPAIDLNEVECRASLEVEEAVFGPSRKRPRLRPTGD
jgi:Trypsin-like peptidase domain